MMNLLVLEQYVSLFANIWAKEEKKTAMVDFPVELELCLTGRLRKALK